MSRLGCRRRTFGLVVGSFVFAAPAFADSLTVPQQLHGFWNKPGECSEYVDGNMAVEAKSFSGWEWMCEPNRVYKTTATSFEARWKCASEGEISVDTFSLKLSGDGKARRLTVSGKDFFLDGEVLERCGDLLKEYPDAVR